ncbi:hypothetical protein [Microbacterium sp. KR10-403]|uniref:hypothetical protein n=1 Tax=Microbacterium sp. KR10-403 TaxID=3158581 RepID=UPI0032E498C6
MIPQILPDDSPRVRASDPETSHEAADATAGSVATSQADVLAVLTDALMPLTDAEIHSYLKGKYSPERVRSARRELEVQGRVRCAGVVKPPGRRTKCRTWEVVS